MGDRKFKSMKVKFEHWDVYIDQYYVGMLSYRLTYGESNVHRYAATDLSGENGWIALGSLLFAIEANDFVLTLASTWSRLMNELRKNVFDPTMWELYNNDRSVAWRTLSAMQLSYRLSFYVTFYSLDHFTSCLRRSGRIRYRYIINKHTTCSILQFDAFSYWAKNIPSVLCVYDMNEVWVEYSDGKTFVCYDRIEQHPNL